MRKVSTAYVLWLLSFIGVSGIHRMYSGRVGTGVIWLLTFGLLGFGTLWDLFFIPSHVKKSNKRQSEFIRNSLAH